jgi:flagellar basal-body rod protein FlgG
MPVGDNLFQETPASGAANIGVPGDPGFAAIEQGYLEAPTSTRSRRSPI